MPLVQADAMFADLIGEDPHLLRAEFDALISASFGKPPVPPPAHSRVPPHPGLPCPPSRCRRPGCAVPDAPSPDRHTAANALLLRRPRRVSRHWL